MTDETEITPESQREQIGKSLSVITDVFRHCKADYRVLGSVLLVAHTNSVFRRINDVDVLLDIRAKNCVFAELIKCGFSMHIKKGGGFSWSEFQKEGCLGLTFLLIGAFKQQYFTWPFLKTFELRMKSEYLKPTEYTFEGSRFIGIPISSAIAGIRQSFLNPKRKMDKEVLKDEVARTNVKTYNNIAVYIGGVKLPYLYDAFSFLYNIFGGVRVLLGRKYEIWD